jgi:glycolate oxidase
MLYEAVRPVTVEMFDVCVPRGEIAGHVGFVHTLERDLDFSIPTYGHAGDGNVHSHCLRAPIEDGLFGKEYPDWEEKTEKARDAIYTDVAARHGVVSGEHGIGLVRRKYLARTIGAAHLGALRAIKRALDPQGILNPGKIMEM